MIIDSIDNISQYEALLPGISERWAQVCAEGHTEVGRYPLTEGFYMIQEGYTKPMAEGTFELHRRYIDVQFLLEGSEEVAWTKRENIEITLPYDEERDMERGRAAHDHRMQMTAGMCYIAFPHDGHQTVSHTEIIQHYKKCIIKVPVE